MVGLTIDYVLFDIDSQRKSKYHLENNSFFSKKYIGNNGYCSYSLSFFETNRDEFVNFINDYNSFDCFVLEKQNTVALIIFLM